MPAISVNKPTVGVDVDAWGGELNAALDTIVDGANATDVLLTAAVDETGIVRIGALPDLSGTYASAGQVTTNTSAIATILPRSPSSRAVAQGELNINVLDYGAKGDMTSKTHLNGTDDTVAINNAFNAAAAAVAAGKSPVVFFPQVAIGYRITSGVVCPDNVNLSMWSPIQYDGAGGETALTVGSGAVQNRRTHRIEVRRTVTSLWASELDVGVVIKTHFHSDISIIQATAFTIGARLIGTLAGAGFTYNRVTLGWLAENKVQLDLVSQSTGYCNQNKFFGGEFSVGSTTNLTLNAYGIRIISDDGVYPTNNANTFYGPSFEMQAPYASGERIPILANHGQRNTFLNVRNEQSSPITIRTTGTSSNNLVELEYTDASNIDAFMGIEDQGTFPSSVVRFGDNPVTVRSTRLVAQWSNLQRKACYYDGATKTHVPGLDLSTNAATPDDAISQAIAVAANYIELSGSRDVGFFLDTSIIKRFTLFTDHDSGYSGRLHIRAYDNTGTVLTSAGAGAPYVQTSTGSNPIYGTAWGGSYVPGADATNYPSRGQYFAVGATVDHVRVAIGGGTAVARLRGMSLYTPDVGQVSTWLASGRLVDDVRNYGTQAPTVGTWAVGRIVWNDAPTAGGTLGWQCVTAGTPGTWSAIATAGGGGGGIAPVYVEKASNEVRNNTATVTDDAELFAPLVVSKTHVVEVALEYDSTTATPDIKVGITVPTGASAKVFPIALVSSATSIAGSISVGTAVNGTGAGSNVVGGTVAATKVWMYLKVRVVMGATAGNMSVHWSQNTATVENTTIYAGSFIKAQQVN